jgi:hypothetical protein
VSQKILEPLLSVTLVATGSQTGLDRLVFASMMYWVDGVPVNVNWKFWLFLTGLTITGA